MHKVISIIVFIVHYTVHIVKGQTIFSNNIYFQVEKNKFDSLLISEGQIT